MMSNLFELQKEEKEHEIDHFLKLSISIEKVYGLKLKLLKLTYLQTQTMAHSHIYDKFFTFQCQPNHVMILGN